MKWFLLVFVIAAAAGDMTPADQLGLGNIVAAYPETFDSQDACQAAASSEDYLRRFRGEEWAKDGGKAGTVCLQGLVH